MKNIHLIPTDKPSRLHLGNSGLVLCDLNFSKNTINGQHIYITSDEEIKERDWVFNFEYDYIVQYDSKKHDDKFWYKKIILTTDQDLIQNGIQTIDDTFLEWFVKNPSCEFVDQRLIWNADKLTSTYKIIIPQEEPKQETIEEAAERNCESAMYPYKDIEKLMFKKGAEWQADRMYSKEDMKQFAEWLIKVNFNYTSNITDMLLTWKEQFKKK